MHPAPKWPATEKDLAAPVVEWLTEQGFEVFQEVEAYNRTADIVARDGRFIWVIECKKSLSLEVIDQADRWRWMATWCSVAVPKPRRGFERPRIVRSILDWRGIGLLEVESPRIHVPIYKPLVTEEIPFHTNRKADYKKWDRFLTEQHKTYCPAGSQSGRLTKFKITKDALVSYVRRNPGVSLKEALEKIKHHYASKSGAVGRTAELIRRGVFPELRLEHDGKYLKLWPTEGAPVSALESSE